LNEVTAAIENSTFLLKFNEMTPKLRYLRKSLNWHIALPEKFGTFRVDLHLVLKLFTSLQAGPPQDIPKRPKNNSANQENPGGFIDCPPVSTDTPFSTTNNNDFSEGVVVDCQNMPPDLFRLVAPHAEGWSKTRAGMILDHTKLPYPAFEQLIGYYR
jgi:hypothetical protein